MRVLALDTTNDEVFRATNNLANVKVIRASYLNVYDILNADTLVVTEKGLEVISEWLGGTK